MNISFRHSALTRSATAENLSGVRWVRFQSAEAHAATSHMRFLASARLSLDLSLESTPLQLPQLGPPCLYTCPLLLPRARTKNRPQNRQRSKRSAWPQFRKRMNHSTASNQARLLALSTLKNGGRAVGGAGGRLATEDKYQAKTSPRLLNQIVGGNRFR